MKSKINIDVPDLSFEDSWMKSIPEYRRCHSMPDRFFVLTNDGVVYFSSLPSKRYYPKSLFRFLKGIQPFAPIEKKHKPLPYSRAQELTNVVLKSCKAETRLLKYVKGIRQ